MFDRDGSWYPADPLANATRRRITTAAWALGVLLLAAGVGLGSRVAQTHVVARRAWLVASDASAARYDAAASDVLYDRVMESLDQATWLARVLGVGLVLLAAGLAFRTRRGKSRAAVLLGIGVLAATWAGLAFVTGHLDHPLFGPILTHGVDAVAPFAAAAAGIAAWALRGRRSAAKVPASGETT